MKNKQSPLTGLGSFSRSSSITSSLLLALAFLGLQANVTSAQTANALNAQINFSSLNASTESTLSMERRVFGLVNRERESGGLRPLVWIDKAAAVARFHSNSMSQSNFLGHRDMNGKKVADRADSFGLSNWVQIGENVIWVTGYEDPAVRAVYSWMRSSGHRQNIMDRKYSETGLGLSISPEGKYYFTQVFVSPR